MGDETNVEPIASKFADAPVKHDASIFSWSHRFAARKFFADPGAEMRPMDQSLTGGDPVLALRAMASALHAGLVATVFAN